MWTLFPLAVEASPRYLKELDSLLSIAKLVSSENYLTAASKSSSFSSTWPLGIDQQFLVLR